MMAIKAGLSINIEDVVAVEREDELTSTIYTSTSQFSSDIPYEAMLQILAKVHNAGEQTEQMVHSLKILQDNAQRFEG